MLFGRKSGCPTMSMEKAELELQNDPNVALIDVRTPEEYARGHIPGSLNIPVERIGGIAERAPDRDARLFVYCLSGSRSAYACEMLLRLGYTNVTNIGGITQWRGAIETAVAVRG